MLNVALFGFTAKAWREANPELAKNSNVRDYASINELTVLSNLETYNAQMIREGKEKKDRFEVLQDIAKYQMGVLNGAARIEQKGGIEIETTGDEDWFGQRCAMRGDDMDIAKLIKDLRESTGMSRKEFSEHTGIPVRTLEDWEAGRRKPPEYIPRLLAYQIKFEKILRKNKEASDTLFEKQEDRRNVSVI